MFIFGVCNESIPADTEEAYYETVASQEEIYLEEIEEELRLTLESDDLPPLSQKSPNQQQEHAVEELITGDSDDQPLGEDTVEEMLLDNNQVKTRRA